MYYSDNFEEYNYGINNYGHDEYDDYYYEDFYKKMPYYREQGAYYRCKDFEEDGDSKSIMDTSINQKNIPVYANNEDSIPVVNFPMTEDDEEDIKDVENQNDYDNDYRCEECNHNHNNHNHHNHNHHNYCKVCKHYGHCMPIMNMTMCGKQMYESDEDLKCMYPMTYICIHPMVKHHCDMMESMYGTMHCPNKGEMDNMCKDVCDMYEKHYRNVEDDFNRDDSEEMRQRRQFDRREGIRDLTRILLIRDLIGRRRRRRMFDHGFHHGY